MESMSLMFDEIAQQPAALEATLREEPDRVRDLRTRFEARRPALVVLVARGTSDNAATFGRYLIEVTTSIPVTLAAPSVTTLYKAPIDWSGALVVGISQSGEGADINLCLEAAAKSGALTVGVTNEPESSMARLVDETLLVRAGSEKSVAATKTYTGQLLMMYLLANALGAEIDLAKLRAIPAAVAAALETQAAVGELAGRFREMQSAVVVARGFNYANAFEFALKLMETSYVVAERFSGADFAHGPIAMVESGFPVFLFAPPGPTLPGAKQMLERLSNLDAQTVLLSPKSLADQLPSTTERIVLPEVPPAEPADLYTPIPYIVPAQLFAAALAEHKGLDPDNPRALTKVTHTL
jgi:glucosamine--fructose-6-phosphate aminotransferase (isomerizing)